MNLKSSMVILSILLAWFSGCKTVGIKNTSLVFSETFGKALIINNICLRDREFFPETPSQLDQRIHLNFDAEGMTLGNAYWMGVMSGLVYPDDKGWADDFSEQFKKMSSRETSNRHEFVQFIDLATSDFEKDRAEQKVKNWYDKFFRETQILWAETNDALLLTFRGTEPEKYQDLLSDLLLLQKSVGTFSGKRTPEKRPDELWQVKDKWSFDSKVHLGFYLTIRPVISKLKKLFGRRGSYDYSINVDGEKVLKSIYFNFLTKQGILDRLIELDEEQTKEALLLMPSWDIPYPVKLAMISNWKKLRDSERQNGLFHMDFDARDAFLGLPVIAMNWQHEPKKIWVNGHSLGGALGTVFSFFTLREGFNIKGLYTYGGPRSGNYGMMRELSLRAMRNGMIKNLVRFVNQNDPVARIPPPVGVVAPPDQWTHFRGRRSIVLDPTTPWGKKLWILPEDIPGFIPDAPIYSGEGVDTADKVRIWSEIQDKQQLLAEKKYLGLAGKVAQSKLDILFPGKISQLDLKALPTWIANHKISHYIDAIGRYAFQGEATYCDRK